MNATHTRPRNKNQRQGALEDHTQNRTERKAEHVKVNFWLNAMHLPI
jgi:hypothetical protein